MQEKLYKIPANTNFIGKKFIYLSSCHSTNDIAAELSPQTEAGTVVITAHQTRGRGQRGNTWEAESGSNLTFSILLKPTFLPASQQFYFNMSIALGIINGLNCIIPKNLNKDWLKLKWSNDVYFQDFKLGGVLIENTIENMNLKSSVVGIGLNINQERFEYPRATSLKNIFEQTFILAEVLEKVLENIEINYLRLQNQVYTKLKNDYLEALYWHNEVHTYQEAKGSFFEGKIIDVQESGRLVIQTTTGIQVFDFKEVIFVK